MRHEAAGAVAMSEASVGAVRPEGPHLAGFGEEERVRSLPEPARRCHKVLLSPLAARALRAHQQRPPRLGVVRCELFEEYVCFPSRRVVACACCHHTPQPFDPQLCCRFNDGHFIVTPPLSHVVAHSPSIFIWQGSKKRGLKHAACS
eukprot:3040467-Rhodomonas_salina.1